MKKIKAVALFSTAILATASTGVYADELISDGTTSPSTEQVTPSTAPSSEVVIPDEGSTTPSTDTGDSDTQTESNTDPSEAVPNVDDAGGVATNHTVPTTDGGTATVTPDTSVPTNNPNISAETAANAGASQVGTTSTVTGQIVQDVTTDSPVYTNTGATIVSTQNGSVVLADGTITSPESIGATTNSDGTISVTTATGESTTLPMTGDENTTLLSILGSALAAIGGLFFKKRQYFN